MIDNLKTGSFIREHRKKQGMSQNVLAEKMMVSREAVSKWENGHNLPDVSIMGRLAEVLDVTVDELLSGEIKEEISDPVTVEKKGIINRLVPGIILGVIVIVIVLMNLNIYPGNSESLRIGSEGIYSYDTNRETGKIYYFEYDPDKVKWQNKEMMTLESDHMNILVFSISRHVSGRNMEDGFEVLQYVRYSENQKPYDLVMFYPGSLDDLADINNLADLKEKVSRKKGFLICEY